jgi:hypothetical protein
MLSTIRPRLEESGLLRVTMEEEDGPPCLSTSANHPGMLSFARGVGCT